MKKIIVFAILIFAGVFTFLLLNSNREQIPVSQNKKEATEKVSSNMKILSFAFKNNTNIPSKYTCDGDDVNPPLEFAEIPTNTKSLVLIVDDPDAPTKTWVHWVVYNISPDVSGVEEDSIPERGIEGMTDFGRVGYGGPCPPSGTHRYFFKLYALDIVLGLPEGATKQMVEEKMKGHVIDQSELIGLYIRE